MSKRKTAWFGVTILSAFLIYACVAAGKKQYEVGMQLSDAGKYREAIAYLNQAIEKEPNNKEYQKSLMDLKEKLVTQFVSQGSRMLSSQSPVTMPIINKAKAELAKAQEVDATHPKVKDFANRIETQERNMLAEVKNLYEKAKSDAAAEQWVEAYFGLQQVQSLFPNYEDSFQHLAAVSDQGSNTLYAQGKSLYDQDDFKGAIDMLRKALSLKPDHGPSRELLSLAMERDNKAYFIGQANQARTAMNWDRAVVLYEKALAYDAEDQDLRQLLAYVREQAAQFNIKKSRDLMEQGLLLKAFNTYKQAMNNIKDKNDHLLNSLRRDLTARAKFAASQLKDQGHSGGAWFWYNEIREIDPEFPNIFFLIQEMEDNIKGRVQKSIAVFDFGSPSDNVDAGGLVANNLITFLFNNASGDIKILERENLKSILEEMKLGQIGVVSAQTAKEMGRVYGIDVAIMGSVLLYKVDSSQSPGAKTVRYKIGEKIEDNIEYLNWAAKHPKPTASELAKAPPAKIKVPEYAEKDYEVANHKKVGFVQLSFRIVDVRTGENIQVRTIEAKQDVEDETSAGLPEAGIKFDPLEIPTETELLKKMTEEVVAELGREALRPLQNLEKQYFQEGENLLRRRDKLTAAESFVDAVFDENLKMIQGSPLAKKAMEHIREIFSEYNVTTREG